MTQGAEDSGTDCRSPILEAAKTGQIDRDRVEAAIATLEKQQTRGDISLLDGEWRLVWTSGTRNYQKWKRSFLTIETAAIAPVIQRIDVTTHRFENEVSFFFATLTVAGSFEYGEKKRLEFTFDRLRLQLGTLPALQLPLGQGASGWLQTTYLDEQLHLERGDRGGVSAYIRVEGDPHPGA